MRTEPARVGVHASVSPKFASVQIHSCCVYHCIRKYHHSPPRHSTGYYLQFSVHRSRKAGQLSVHRRSAVLCRDRLAENADIFLWVIRYIGENPHGRGFRTKRVHGRRVESGRGRILRHWHHPLENSHAAVQSPVPP